MSTALRLTLLTVLIVAILIAWRGSVAHLYNPTMRSTIASPDSPTTPTSAELSARIYGLGN